MHAMAYPQCSFLELMTLVILVVTLHVSAYAKLRLAQMVHVQWAITMDTGCSNTKRVWPNRYRLCNRKFNLTFLQKHLHLNWLRNMSLQYGQFSGTTKNCQNDTLMIQMMCFCATDSHVKVLPATTKIYQIISQVDSQWQERKTSYHHQNPICYMFLNQWLHIIFMRAIQILPSHSEIGLILDTLENI